MLDYFKQKYIIFIVPIMILLMLGPLADIAMAASAIVTGKVVNIRSGPGSNYVKKGSLLQGAIVTVNASTGQWCKVSLRSGLTGWVNKSYLKINWSSSTPVKTTTVSKAAKIEITTKIANLRSGPGTKYVIKAKAKKGDKLELLGNNNGWYKVKTSQGIAYILQGLAKIWTIPAAYADEVEPSVQENPNTTKNPPGPASSGQGTDLIYVNVPEVPSNNNVSSNTSENTTPPDTNQGSQNEVEAAAPVADSPSQVNSIKIVLDAGHGGKDPGAVGRGGTLEKDINLSLISKTGALLEQAGYQVKYTRSDDTYVGLYDRVDTANNQSAQLFISIHCNASESSSKRGNSVYYYVDENRPAAVAQSAQRDLLARSVRDRMIQSLGLSDDGVHDRMGFVVIRYTNMPAILIETAYLSNSQEENLLNDQSFQDNVARSIVDGINNYLSNPLSKQIDLSSSIVPAADFDSQFNFVK
ncbi:MAG: N-acetylmuramoyl-L-alanine amidase [Ignavibacteriales bacterium]